MKYIHPVDHQPVRIRKVDKIFKRKLDVKKNLKN